MRSKIGGRFRSVLGRNPKALGVDREDRFCNGIELEAALMGIRVSMIERSAILQRLTSHQKLLEYVRAIDPELHAMILKETKPE